MLNFYLIRHGHKEYVPFDPPLSGIGIQQAKITAEFLKNLQLKEIISSPKTRTRQTAETIAKIHTMPVKFDVRIIERLEWENKETFEEFVNEWSKTDLDRNHIPIKGNSSVNKGKIMKSVFDEYTLKYSDGNLVIVTHGGAIGDLLRNIFGELNIAHDIDPLTKAPHIHISECSITKIQAKNGEFNLIDINNTSHLPVELISKE